MADTLATRIQQRLDELGLSARAAAISAGGSPWLIQNILAGKSANPRGDTLKKLADVLQVTEQWLLTGEDVSAPQPAQAQPTPSDVRLAPNIKLPDLYTLPKDVGVLGSAAGSELGRGAFQLSSDVIEYVRRPPGLFGVKDAYALYVEGDSMYPRFEQGDLIFVHPHRKPRGGDYVVVQEPDTDNGESRAFVKRLKRVTGTALVCEQFNPPATIEFVLRPGLVWHKVLTDGDLYSF